VAYLHAAGYDVLKQRYKTPEGEIDIIAADAGGNLIFIEIKARKRVEHYELLSSRQRQRIIRASYHYMAEYGSLEQGARFDLIIIANNTIVEHIESAWDTAG
jgi:putative endonuclease